MKAQVAVVSEPGSVTLLPSELREPAAGEVVIGAAYSALSPGTEQHVMQGIQWPPPIAIGYALCGYVVATGPGVTQLAVGDAVVTTAPHASHFVADQRFVTPVPEGVDLEQAAFFNLAHTALYGVRQAKVELGEAVVVIGQGVVGLLAARMAQLAGGLPVIAVDVDEQRLEFSRRLGIHEVVNGTDTARLARITRALPGGGAPVVIEVTGLRAPLDQALDVVGTRGRIVMLGVTHGTESVDFHDRLTMKGAALIGAYVNSKPWALSQTQVEIVQWPPTLAPGSQRYAGPGVWTSDEDVRVVLNLIRYGSLDISPLITHRFTPSQLPDAYELVKRGDRSLIGGVIRWR
jgi:2-desacetyl-2-hydroxyethyl bacteriochlorophyllide A dehydrogenase